MIVRSQRFLSLVIAAFIAVMVLSVGGTSSQRTDLWQSDFWQSDFWRSSPVMAQRPRPQDVWRLVYQQIPILPLENQYVSKSTGQVDPNNTLVSRLLQYHAYAKGRPPNLRFDWKLTLADYLGANEVMELTRYPGYETLQTNPIEGDRAAITRLTRLQREALIQALVNVFTPAEAASPQAPPTPNANPASPSVTPNSGGAQLLRP